jgi:hypothetical protein
MHADKCLQNVILVVASFEYNITRKPCGDEGTTQSPFVNLIT